MMVAFAQLALVFVAACLAFVFNYLMTHRVERRLRTADALRQRLYRFLELTSDYWIAGAKSGATLEGLEAKIQAHQRLIVIESELMATHSRRLKGWYERSADRRHLFDSVTGMNHETGVSFPASVSHVPWQPSRRRVTEAANKIASIVLSLEKSLGPQRWWLRRRAD